MPPDDIVASFRLDGQTAIVTGAAAGIGLACASRLGAAGARIVAVDLREPELAEAVSLLKGQEIDAVGRLADVSVEPLVESVVAGVTREFGPASVLINCAGLGAHVLPENVELDFWRRIIDINLTSSFLMSRAFARELAGTGLPGSIVNVSSIGGASSLGRGNFCFGIAKAGLNQLTRELAVEWAGAGIRVNAVLPLPGEHSGLPAAGQSRRGGACATGQDAARHPHGPPGRGPRDCRSGAFPGQSRSLEHHRRPACYRRRQLCPECRGHAPATMTDF